MIVNIILKSRASYKVEDMVQQFLPNHLKGFDYDMNLIFCISTRDSLYGHAQKAWRRQ